MTESKKGIEPSSKFSISVEYETRGCGREPSRKGWTWALLLIGAFLVVGGIALLQMDDYSVFSSIESFVSVITVFSGV